MSTFVPPTLSPADSEIVKRLEREYLLRLIQEYARFFFYAGKATAQADAGKLTRYHKQQAELFAKIEAILGGPHDPQTDPVPR